MTALDFTARAEAVRLRFSQWRTPLLIGASALFIVGLTVSLRSLDMASNRFDIRYAAVGLLILAPISVFASAFSLQLTARVLGRNIRFIDALGAVSLGDIAELIPGPAGAVVKGGLLMKSGASIAESIWVLAITAVLWVSITLAMASAVLIESYRYIGLVGLVSGVFGSAGCLFLIAQRSNVGIAISTLGIRVASVCIAIIRLQVVFAAIGTSISPSSAVLFTFSITLASASSIAPAGLGLSELFAAAIATVAGISPATAFAAVALNRVLGLLACAMISGVVAFRASRGTASHH